MASPPESDRQPIQGHEPVHRVAQSYLGTLWIALNKQADPPELVVLRRVCLPPGTPEGPRQAMLAAARCAQSLHHDNVLGIIDVLEEDNQIGLVSPHLEAEPMRSLQSWANLRCLPFPTEVVLRVMGDLLAGLQAIHEESSDLHPAATFGGLSPDSILIARDGRTLIADAYVSACASLLPEFGRNTAKLSYAAPEQAQAVTELSEQSDVFACGGLLWELLTGRRLLTGAPATLERKLLEHDLPSLETQLRGQRQISTALLELVGRALSANPSDRPASAADLRRQLLNCGHEIATVQAVATYVGKLSGQRFERRIAAVRTKSSPHLMKVNVARIQPVRVPLPAMAPATALDGTIRGVAPPPSQIATPRPPRLPDADPVGPGAPGVVPAPAFSPAAASGGPPPRGRRPAGGRTMTGIGGGGAPAPGLVSPVARAPAGALDWEGARAAADHEPPPSTLAAPGASAQMAGHAAAVARKESPLPASRTSPDAGAPPSSAARAVGSESTALASPVVADWPGSSRAGDAPYALPEDLAGLPPPRPRLGPLLAGLGRRLRDAASSLRWPPVGALLRRVTTHDPGRTRTLLAVFMATTALLTGLVAVMLIRWPAASRTAEASAVASDADEANATASDADEVNAAASDAEENDGTDETLEASDAVEAERTGAAASADETAPPSGTERRGRAPAGTEAPDDVPGETEPGALDGAPGDLAPGNLDQPELDDQQLATLFALERRKRLRECSPAASGASVPPTDVALAQARKALLRGQPELALDALCRAVLGDSGSVDARRELAELALGHGDPTRARQEVSRALELEPDSPELTALLGDSLALLGDLPGARAAWLQILPATQSAATRSRRLAGSYAKLGRSSLAGASHAQALAFYRRALILTRGSYASSLGLSRALLALGRVRAAEVWTGRAARAFPKDSRVQLLRGDVLHAAGQPEAAKAAWQTALDLRPSYRAAARRLARGEP